MDRLKIGALCAAIVIVGAIMVRCSGDLGDGTKETAKYQQISNSKDGKIPGIKKALGR